MGTKPGDAVTEEVLEQARAAAIEDQSAGEDGGDIIAPEAEERRIPRPLGDRDLDELAAAADGGDEVVRAYFEGVYQGAAGTVELALSAFAAGPQAVLDAMEHSASNAEAAHLAAQEGGLAGLLEEYHREAEESRRRFNELAGELLDLIFGPAEESGLGEQEPAGDRTA